MNLSKDEVMYVKDEYDKMGFPSEVKKQGYGYICEISKKWYSYEGVLPQVNDSFYIKGENENLPYKIISFEIEDDVCKLKVQLEGADDENEEYIKLSKKSNPDKVLKLKLNKKPDKVLKLDTFNILKITPWTAKDKRDYYIKYELPKKTLGVLGVLLGIVLILGLIALLIWGILSPTTNEVAADIFGDDFAEIFSIVKYAAIVIILTSIAASLMKHLNRY